MKTRYSLITHAVSLQRVLYWQVEDESGGPAGDGMSIIRHSSVLIGAHVLAVWNLKLFGSNDHLCQWLQTNTSWQ